MIAPARGTSPRLDSIATALPPHGATQGETRRFARQLFSRGLAPGDERLFAVFDNAGVERRWFVEPLEWYDQPRGFGEMNEAYVRHAVALGIQAVSAALERCGLTPQDIDHIVMVSTTGLATPSLDARIANQLPFRADVRRTPIWGLGCAGGAAGLARARDFALADPESRVLVLALELCSLTFQRGDLDRRNLVAASLFADGAAAAVVSGAAAAVPRSPFRALALEASRSTLWPGTLDVMGWDVDDSGLHVVFSRDIPTFVRERLKPALDRFLAERGVPAGGLAHVVAHPGGPRVLGAYAEALGVPPETFRHSAAVLRECGNMSSPTVLFVLERTLASGDIGAGDRAVIAALGPGFSSELVLARGLDE
jgi:alkylresorcinol/alkylpyrone synthase